MAKLDLRVRLLGRALRPLSITRMDDERVARMQSQSPGHNPGLDAPGTARAVRRLGAALVPA